MRARTPPHTFPSLSALGYALAAGLFEWIALWRSRQRRRAPSLRS